MAKAAATLLVVAGPIEVIGWAAPASASSATLYVDATGTGDCTSLVSACSTIQAAVTLAESVSNSALTIDVAAGSYDEAPVVINVPAGDTFTIVGAGAGTTVLDDGGAGTDISVYGGTATISGLTITGGVATTRSLFSLAPEADGGGVFNEGDLTLTSDSISDNEAAHFGGGVANLAGTLKLSADTISDNSSANQGGGIYAWGKAVTATNDTITDNHATLFGGGISGGNAATFTSSTITYNTAGYGFSGGLGGAGELTGSLIAHNSGNCRNIWAGSYNVADDSSCSPETSGTGNIVSTDAAIGPLSLAANGSTGPETEALTGTSSAFQDVPAAYCPATDERGVARPGAPGANCDAGAFELQVVNLYVDPAGSATSGCSAPGVAACQTIGEGMDTASGYVGTAITVDIAAGTYDESVSDNLPASDWLALSGAGVGSTTIDDGGTGPDLSVASGSTVQVSGITLSGGASTDGGAVDDSGGTVTLIDDDLWGNEASQLGGGLYESGGSVSLQGVTVSNDAAGESGGGLYNDGGALQLTDTAFSDDSAGPGGTSVSGDDGGGVYISGGSTTITNGSFTNDSAADAGAGLYNSGTSTASITGDTFSDDSAPFDAGGGIYNDATASLREDTFSNDSAGDGGAIWNYGTLSATNATFADNRANDGGAIGTANPTNGSGLTASLSFDTFSNNSAGDAGGGGAIDSYDGFSTVSYSVFANNTDSQGPDSCAAGGVTDHGYNVESDDTCNFLASAGSVNDSPDIGLVPLSANGSTGPDTEAITVSSSAFGIVPSISCLTAPTDERGLARPGFVGENCDAGAFELQPTAQSITFTSTTPADAVVGGPSYTVAATGGGSGEPVTFSLDASSTGCALSGATVTFPAAGVCVLDANQASAGTYSAAPQVEQSFAIAQAAQAITFTSTAPADAVVGGPSYTAAATGGGSGEPVVFSLDPTSTGCTLSGPVVSFAEVGTCVIDANQVGNTDYLSAQQAQEAFSVSQGTTAVTASITGGAVTYGHQTGVSFAATVAPESAGETGTVTFTAGTAVLCTAQVVSGAAHCSMSTTAPLLPAGENSVIAAYSGDGNFIRSKSRAGYVVVARASVRVGLTVSPSTVTFGREQVARFTVTLVPQYLGLPTGTVLVMAGKTRLCSLAISPKSGGTGHCSSVAGALKAGKYSVAADFVPSTLNFAASSSRPVTFAVTS
jgi:hypothetical protein